MKRRPVLAVVLGAVVGCTAAAVLLGGPALGAHWRADMADRQDAATLAAAESVRLPAAFRAPDDGAHCGDAFSCWSVDAVPDALESDLTEALAAVAWDVIWTCDMSPVHEGTPLGCTATGRVGLAT